jgi:hypothetical protein
MLLICQYWQRTGKPRQVLESRSRNTQSAKALFPCKVQIFRERQTLWLIYKTNDFFSPTIGTGIVYCAGYALRIGKKYVLRVMTFVDLGQVLADRKTGIQPGGAVAQKDANALVF